MLPNVNNQKISYLVRIFSDVRAVGLMMFGVVVILVTWSSLKVMQTNYELQKKEAELTQENAVSSLENENLKLKNIYFETDQYLELTARRQFNKSAPGEKLYLVPEDVAHSYTVDLPKTGTQVAEEKRANKSKYQQNFEAWLDFIFNRQG